MTIAAVPPAHVREVLAEFAVEVRKALESGQGDATNGAELLADLEAGKSQLWVAHDDDGAHGVLVVSGQQFVTGRKVWVDLIAGRDMDRWADDAEAALKEACARTESMCVEGSCRPGLAEYLKRRGWRVKAIIMEAPA